VAAIQGIVLTIAVTNLWPGPAVDCLLAAALALLAESFGRDLWWLRCQHTRAVQRVHRVGVMMAGSE
jgi:hypothetical protein